MLGKLAKLLIISGDACNEIVVVFFFLMLNLSRWYSSRNLLGPSSCTYIWISTHLGGKDYVHIYLAVRTELKQCLDLLNTIFHVFHDLDVAVV